MNHLFSQAPQDLFVRIWCRISIFLLHTGNAADVGVSPSWGHPKSKIMQSLECIRYQFSGSVKNDVFFSNIEFGDPCFETCPFIGTWISRCFVQQKG